MFIRNPTIITFVQLLLQAFPINLLKGEIDDKVDTSNIIVYFQQPIQSSSSVCLVPASTEFKG